MDSAQSREFTYPEVHETPRVYSPYVIIEHDDFIDGLWLNPDCEPTNIAAFAIALAKAAQREKQDGKRA